MANDASPARRSCGRRVGLCATALAVLTAWPADPDLSIRNRYGETSVIPASERGTSATSAGWWRRRSTSTT